MTSPLRVHGSHREVGEQIGLACRDAIRRATTFTPDQLPADRSLEEQLALADRFRAATADALPWLVVELDAVAQAADVDPRRLFAASTEEIWPGQHLTGQAPTPAFRGCTDLAGTAPATATGRTLIGHNNDLPARVQPDVVAVEWRVDGAPTVFSLGIGPWLSAAWNGNGVNITGNELSPNDDRVGIPRLLLMTAVTRAGSLEEAKAVAAHDRRASSYNWLLADDRTEVVSLEGSATAMAELRPDERGLLHHENHYTDGSMCGFERDPQHASHSEARGRRVAELLDEVEPGTLTPERVRAILSDHEGAPDSLCRHADGPDGIQTVFWSVADPGARQVDYGIGPPCRTEAQRYVFE